MKYGKRVDTRIRVFPMQIAVRISSVVSSEKCATLAGGDDKVELTETEEKILYATLQILAIPLVICWL